MKLKFFKNSLNSLYAFLTGLILLLPKAVFAFNLVPPPPIDPIQNCNNFKAQFFGAFDWVNTEYCTASGLALFVIKLIINMSGVVAIVFLMVGGFLYMTSSGNEEAAEKGKKIIINAIIGLVVIIMAGTIVTIISNLVTTK